MKRILLFAAFVVVSIILVENAPAPPPPPSAPLGGTFLTDGTAVGLMLAYGLWRMRK